MPRISAVPTSDGFTLIETLAALLIAVLLIGAISSGFMRVLLAERRALQTRSGALAVWAEASAAFLDHATTGSLWRSSTYTRTLPTDPPRTWYGIRLKPPREELPEIVFYLSERYAVPENDPRRPGAFY